MTHIKQIEGPDGQKRHLHWCSGCKTTHQIQLNRDGSQNKWEWNGSLTHPSYMPSLKHMSGHHVPGHSGTCWCTYVPTDGEPSPFKCYICHYYITDGKIIYCGDTTHELSGMTVDLEDIPDIEE